jgi:uracil-DNA glycosylase
LRGERHTVHGIALVATYHPTYLLSHPAQKRAVFEDMKLVRRLLEESTGRTLAPIARQRGAKS